MIIVPVLRTAIAALLLVFVAPLLLAQEPPPPPYPRPCPTDCPQDTVWTFYGPVGLSYPGCSVSVSFWYRSNQCGQYEISIADITVSGSGCNLTTALQEAMKGIIAANPMNFPPTAKGQCSDQWRVTNSACWKEFHEQITPTYSVTHYQPCFTNNCCYVKLRVCIDQQGNRTASTIPPMDGEPPVINCTPDCPNFICEAQRNTFPPVQNMIKPQHPIQQQEFSTLPNQELNTTVQASETTSAIQNHR